MSKIPAEIKRRENIAEYIIHMYQTEDLILNYKFNLDAILQYVIQHMSNDEKVIKELLLWYAGIIDRMQIEKITGNGKHLASTQKIVCELFDLHLKLITTELEYRSIYEKAEKDININIQKSKGEVTDPVQACLNGVYGMLLLKLNGKQIPPDQEKPLKAFGNVLAYLSNRYQEK